jgi:hypothetical protein
MFLSVPIDASLATVFRTIDGHNTMHNLGLTYHGTAGGGAWHLDNLLILARMVAKERTTLDVRIFDDEWRSLRADQTWDRLRDLLNADKFNIPPPSDYEEQKRSEQYIRQGILEARARAPEITEEQREDEWRAMMRFLQPDFGDQDDDEEALKRWWEEREAEYEQSRTDPEIAKAIAGRAEAARAELKRCRRAALEATDAALEAFVPKARRRKPHGDTVRKVAAAQILVRETGISPSAARKRVKVDPKTYRAHRDHPEVLADMEYLWGLEEFRERVAKEGEFEGI